MGRIHAEHPAGNAQVGVHLSGQPVEGHSKLHVVAVRVGHASIARHALAGAKDHVQAHGSEAPIRHAHPRLVGQQFSHGLRDNVLHGNGNGRHHVIAALVLHAGQVGFKVVLVLRATVLNRPDADLALEVFSVGADHLAKDDTVCHLIPRPNDGRHGVAFVGRLEHRPVIHARCVQPDASGVVSRALAADVLRPLVVVLLAGVKGQLVVEGVGVGAKVVGGALSAVVLLPHCNSLGVEVVDHAIPAPARKYRVGLPVNLGGAVGRCKPEVQTGALGKVSIGFLGSLVGVRDDYPLGVVLCLSLYRVVQVPDPLKQPLRCHHRSKHAGVDQLGLVI